MKFGTNEEEMELIFLCSSCLNHPLGQDIAVILELATSTIEKVIAKLKDDKVIEREGSTKSEYWK
ncbi:hypothetical protein [Flavobacterium sp. ZS1P14]|uniref:hypothetical protein n=1 Tax=Flavobacterium sp. ZS1P14 TaxID=3401729 RepID=UPI003AAFC58F